MSLQRQLLFWVGALIAFIAVFWVLHEVLLPFVVAMALAYFLNPVADRLERLGVDRLVATLIIIGLFLLVFVIAAIVLVPILASQMFSFIQRLPGIINRIQELLVTPENKELLRRLFGDNVPDFQKSVGDLVTQGAVWLGGFLQSLWSGGRALINVFAIIVITPVVAAYMLLDWRKMLDRIDSWVPVKNRDVIRRLGHDMDRAVAGFVRGQASVALILGSFYAVALTLAGLNFGLLIGVMSGLLTFVPYVGSLFGLIVAGGVAVVQFWPDWTMIVTIIVIFIGGQFVEGYILAPNLVGQSIGLHPVWLMFALFAFGYLFGFVGLLLAVPLAAAIGVLVRFGIKQYLASPLYTGESRHRLPPGDR
jgi:predicted PurR-regulated permease PerM